MTERPAWCVRAMICDDCNGITAVIYPAAIITDKAWKAHLNGTAIGGDDSKEETSRSGNDWRPLLIEAVTELARRTGHYISDSCALAYTYDGERDEASVAEANKTLRVLLDAQVADVQQMTREEKQQIIVRWEELYDLTREAGISEAEREQRTKAVVDYATASLRHARAFAEYFAREFPDGPGPDSGATEAERQMILDSIVRPYQRRHN
jgi:hypothetical protein